MKYKQIHKRLDGKCYFCPINDYALLDAHRIQEGGSYDWFNCLTLCANCHRKVHSGRIKVFRKYLSTSGHWVLHYIDEEGVERFK